MCTPSDGSVQVRWCVGLLPRSACRSACLSNMQAYTCRELVICKRESQSRWFCACVRVCVCMCVRACMLCVRACMLCVRASSLRVYVSCYCVVLVVIVVGRRVVHEFPRRRSKRRHLCQLPGTRCSTYCSTTHRPTNQPMLSLKSIRINSKQFI